ncbi:MAG: DUF1501 domain-containing protein [Bacteroidia bacterium]|nr:DUF1501 domain-containing protein [Bacteroidia bacterium]MBP7270644.1 DUF1501 domain-containing protein [Bacteroidia bacterium]MBP7438245.1 DUF1501 domain-containing protein [Bacteroidia bacterium]MBP7772320.1 DUF1501 domain-containing protein [Bacteroidia bacterium]
MKRRDFLRTAIPAAVVPAVLNGLPLKAFASSPLAEAISATDNDHVLVMIQLNGGNDGLNTIIPLDQYANLTRARQNILPLANRILLLNGTTLTGMHPSMVGLQQLYNDGKLNIIQSVGYPNPDFSHFRATDIWLTGSDSDQVLTSGVMGRYLNYEYPNFPTGYPNAVMPDPLAIQIGSSVSLGLMGPAAYMGMSVTDPDDFYHIINGVQDPAPNTPAGDELTYVRGIARQTRAYQSVIEAAAARVPTQATAYPAPGTNYLADQLKIVARLVAGGLKTKLYMVSIGGFDTHSSQTEDGDTSIGTHADLLRQLSEAILAFQIDCAFLNIEDRVVGMTYSEFGRRVKSNASFGTDHGAAAPVLVFGKQVQSGIVGASPVIPYQAGSNNNLPMQYDFRSVYASILQDWFCVPPTDLQTILFNNYQTLPIIKSSACLGIGIHELNQATGLQLISNSPNPFSSSTYITYTTQGGHTRVQVFSPEGKLIKNLVDAEQSAGTYKVWFENEHFAPGVYYARLQNGPIAQVANMVIVP